MLSQTLAASWLSGFEAVSLSHQAKMAVWLCCDRNKMVTTFGNSKWMTQTEGSVLSRSVASCVGMTARLVLLAQTRVGFLSGGRSKLTRNLPPAEQIAQRTYARVTFALTRGHSI